MKLTNTQAKEIRKLYRQGTTLKALAKQFKISTATAHRIVMNRAYADPNYKPPVNKSVSLRDETLTVLHLRLQGLSYQDIADYLAEEAELKVSANAVNTLVNKVRANLKKPKG